jgi:hypothetical protein
LARTIVDLDGVALDGEGERRGRGRSSMGGGVERGGHPPQHRIRATPACVAAATGGDQCLCTLRLERGDWISGEWHGCNDRPAQLETGVDRLLVAPSQLQVFFPISNSAQIHKFKMEAFSCSKNIQTLYDARFEYLEQLYQLGRLQIIYIVHAINSTKEFNLNLL